MKRKADTTTPHASIIPPNPSYKPLTPSYPGPPLSLSQTPASISSRRESGRPVKKPKKDLDDEPVQHCAKVKKEPLTEALKHCGNILRELLSKKHAVSLLWRIILSIAVFIYVFWKKNRSVRARSECIRYMLKHNKKTEQELNLNARNQ